MKRCEIFRPMDADKSGHPQLGAKSTSLGARDRDIEVDKDNMVTDKNGPSVALNVKGVHGLPSYLHPFIPRLLPVQLRMPSADCKRTLFQFENAEFEPFACGAPISEELKLMGKSHCEDLGYIAPRTPVSPDAFAACMRKTAACWQKIEWEAAAESINALAEY